MLKAAKGLMWTYYTKLSGTLTNLFTKFQITGHLYRREFLPVSDLNLMILRPSLPEDQAGVIHAISPFWMKLCQIEGTTQQL